MRQTRQGCPMIPMSYADTNQIDFTIVGAMVCLCFYGNLVGARIRSYLYVINDNICDDAIVRIE